MTSERDDRPGPSPPARGRPSPLCVPAAALILVLCWTPSRRMPVAETVPRLPYLDKAIHAGMFALYGASTMLGGRRGLMLALGVALAVVSELGQATSWVARDANVADGAADVVGLLVGALVVRAWRGRAGGP